MAEEVQTGGLVSFRYNKEHGQKLGEEDRNKIKDAYARAAERKRLEKRNRMIMWIVIIAIILLVVWGFQIF